MKNYGEFANIVAIAGSLSSSVMAISLSFLGRSKWQPPEEALPRASARLAALLAMVVLALLYVFGAKLGLIWVAVVTVVFFFVAVISLWTAIKTNTKYSFYWPEQEIEINRRLGGDVLTAQAKKIKDAKQQTEKQMFQDAQGDKDLVWTRESQAAVQFRSTLSFILLIGFGTCTLAAAATLVAVSMGSR